MAAPLYLVSHDAQEALRQFSQEFDAAYTVADPGTWAKDIGLTNSSKNILTTYPIPISAAKYVEKKGETKFRTLYERSLSMSPVEWEDAVSILASKIEAPDFVGWSSEPTRIATEGARQPAKLVAAMLHANPLLDMYTSRARGGIIALSTIRLFASNHPVNIFDTAQGTFDNDLAITGIDATSISTVKLHFRSVKAPNGEPAGLEFDTLLIPAALEEQAKDFFESDNLILAVENAGGTIVGGVPTNNRHKGTVKVIVCPELLDANVCYALDVSSGAYPWVLQDGGAPEQIIFDKTDHMYKTTGMVAFSSKLTMAVAAALPLAIARLTIS
jgi:phage major head subunit gpT-like protein